MLWNFTKQKKVPGYVYEITTGHRCKSCFVEKDTTQVISMDEYDAILNEKYCTPCDTRITRSKKLSHITDGDVGWFSSNFRETYEFILTRKFDMYMLGVFGGVWLIYLAFMIFMDAPTFLLNVGLCIYWVILVLRNQHIKKKVQSL